MDEVRVWATKYFNWRFVIATKRSHHPMSIKGSRKTILTLFGILKITEHVTILRRLREGLDINTVDSGGRTLLMEAVVKGDHELVDILIERGADVNIRDQRNWTALHFAAQANDLVSVRKLVEHRAEINAQDDFGNTPIANAVFNSRGKGEVIQFLLTHGADRSKKNNSGISAVDLAKTISNYDVAKFFE
jgi:ankyrin repeat protein